MLKKLTKQPLLPASYRVIVTSNQSNDFISTELKMYLVCIKIELSSSGEKGVQSKVEA